VLSPRTWRIEKNHNHRHLNNNNLQAKGVAGSFFFIPTKAAFGFKEFDISEANPWHPLKFLGETWHNGQIG